MNKNEIITAKQNGQRVFWCNANYEVVTGANGYDIESKANGHRIGLSGLDGTAYENQLNGAEADFYISEDGQRPAVHLASRRYSLAEMARVEQSVIDGIAGKTPEAPEATQTPAEKNEAAIYQGLEVAAEASEISFQKTGLYTFEVYAEAKDDLHKAIGALAIAGLSFTSHEIFINNLYGAELTIPRILIEDDAETSDDDAAETAEDRPQALNEAGAKVEAGFTGQMARDSIYEAADDNYLLVSDTKISDNHYILEIKEYFGHRNELGEPCDAASDDDFHTVFEYVSSDDTTYKRTFSDLSIYAK